MPCPMSLGLLARRVHAGVDVDVVRGPVALVVDRAGGVERAHRSSHGADVATAPGLVAEGPQDDARVVGVAAHRAGHAVDEDLFPRGVVHGVAGPSAVDEAVGLEVVLVDDVQPVLVAEVEEVRVRRVVAGADRVDVVALHEEHVLEHALRGDRAAAQRVELVTVDAAELHGSTVDEEHAIFDRDGPEAGAERDGLPRRRDDHVVEARALGAPRLDVRRGSLPRSDVDPEARAR